MSNYITVDVGGTYVKHALMDENADIKEKGEIPTPHEGLEAFVDVLIDIYNLYKDAEPVAYVMSAPGKIDSQTGYFYTSGALGYISGINLKDVLADKIPVPFAVENDAKAAALAELWKGSMQGITNGTVITLGTGIGGAIIINGQLYRGSTFAAGEYSNISAHLDEPFSSRRTWARQNGVGCLVKRYAELVEKDEEEVSGRILFDAANAGDQLAILAIKEYCQGVGTGIISLQSIIDVEKYAIGGGISKQPLLMEILNKEIDARFAELKGRSPMTRPEVVACTFGNDANMIGALYHYLFEMK